MNEKYRVYAYRPPLNGPTITRYNTSSSSISHGHRYRHFRCQLPSCLFSCRDLRWKFEKVFGPARQLFGKMKFALGFLKWLCKSEVADVDDVPGVEIPPNFHLFSYAELKTASNGFRSSNKIGAGGFGSVYKGRLEDGRIIGLKVLSVESKQGEREFMSEIASLSNINHENLVKLQGCCVDGPSRILVYEYMENDNLARTFLANNQRAKFSWKARREVSIGIAKGLAYIHEQVKPPIIHRDIKPSNILLDWNFTPKITDFGLSKLFPDNISHISTRVAGTLGYLAPEYALSGHLRRKSDVYSFGVLLLEIITGKLPVDFDPEHGEIYLVQTAYDMYKADKLLDLVDPLLENNFSEKEAIRYLKLGLLCVQERYILRPRMPMAVQMMIDDQINIHNLEISKPGLVSDITDVKVSKKSPSRHSISLARLAASAWSSFSSSSSSTSGSSPLRSYNLR